MLLGIRNKRVIFMRQTFMATVAALLAFIVWNLNAEWSPDMRLWKAFGGATFILLWFTVFVGPFARLWRPAVRFVPWRRESGVWFALLGGVHAYLVLDGWVRWGVWEFLGFRYVPEIEMYLRSEPGFGLANTMGILAIVFALILAATSSDRAVNFLGISSWKWLHTFAYVIFYLAALHALYFAFIHFSPSPERVLLRLPTSYPANPLRFFYAGAFLSVVSVQVAAFVKAVRIQRSFGKH